MRASSRVWTAPLTLAAAGLFVFEVIWFGLNLPAKTGPAILGTTPAILGSAVTALAMRQAWTSPGSAPPVRRFWRTMTLSSAAISVMQLTDLPGYLERPSIQPNAASLTVYGVAMISIVVALYRLPLGARGPGGRLRFLLDCATVTLAALLVSWYATLAGASTESTAEVATSTIVVSVALALVVLALAKVVLSGGRTIYPPALRALGIGLAMEMVGVFIMPLVADRPQVASEPLGRSAMYLLVTAAAVYQCRAARLPETAWRQPKERTFSRIPYVAVAAVEAFLMYAIRGESAAVLVIGGGAVALTALLMARQLAAFRENGRLIAEVRSYHDQLEYQANHDSLTGLANRALFTTELAGPAADGCHLALIDLDGFKAVNDTLGHHTGDELLVAVADRLRTSVRPGDLVARLGGDEFAVILRGLTDAETDEVLGRMLHTLQQPLVVDGQEVGVQASIGVAIGDGSDPAELVKRADAAMYQAKRAGKGQFARYAEV
ncbi:GGDEF domain-containing protein [Actinoplanes sp. NPDC026619]|uniref:GGDEF domain-containing protein n=1 Tax=Actinoplanes sp. NPDC026619 TaxID=3155798 RepID=UPI003407B741